MANAHAADAAFSFLSRELAEQVDCDVNKSGIALPQGLELEGLSVASAIAREYPPEQFPRVVVVSGPGNNGGDGLSVARHLFNFGYSPSVVYPKLEQMVEKSELFARLVQHLRCLGIEPATEFAGLHGFDLAVDAVFGFTFRGWRGGGRDAPFDAIVEALAASPVPVVSIDIPSGWDTDAGPPPSGPALQPEMLVSLLAPKQCARHFRGRHHYLGGRFVAPSIVEKYKLRLPAYPGCEQCVKLPAQEL
mmetsp:Transcript_21593/g.68408  ORF Transcript_21593/g.68408 Transcript_21593/m.68408 type:complete len:248 (-) Transcript_21593:112-855(-)